MIMFDWTAFVMGKRIKWERKLEERKEAAPIWRMHKFQANADKNKIIVNKLKVIVVIKLLLFCRNQVYV